VQKILHTKSISKTITVYRKQFKIPEAHQNFIETTLDKWLKLGVVKRSNPL
jgi:hypothetical protein